jgi:hypothetical protein
MLVSQDFGEIVILIGAGALLFALLRSKLTPKKEPISLVYIHHDWLWKESNRMAQTHTSLLHRFGYHRVGIRRQIGLFQKAKGIRYFQDAEGYIVAIRPNGAWRQCSPNGKRIGKRQKENDFHGAANLERQLTKIHGASR